jgi:hypothetical protein
MKKGLILVMVASLSLLACNPKPKGEPDELSTDLINNPLSAGKEAEGAENLPAFEFEEEVVDFGEISQGEKVKRRFKFKNVGKSNLIISDAKGSCGCTVPLWPKQPIRPGQEGVIEVVFDSNGKQGRQSKTVTLIANTVPNTKVLAIKGDVLVPNQKNQ